jgi:beta-glucosidase
MTLTEDHSTTASRFDALIAQLTLEEKVALMAGADAWHTAAVPRLGIPALKMTDGPNGARGDTFKTGLKAAVFPVGIVLAQTWNPALVERVGAAIAQEARTKSAQVLLAPTVNIHRSPLGGRNFESYSEDPYLTARMAVAYIRGVQGEGIGAMAKHYLGNEQETDRHHSSSDMDERTLREIYLPPFEAAVREAGVWAIMASYNRVNGIAASEHPYLLTDILRGEWGWDGYTVSDWVFSVKSTAPSVNAGLDLEMPGPGIWRGAALLDAVRRGDVAEATLDASIRRLLTLLERVGKFEQPDEAPERAVDLPEHRALIRQAGCEGMVLLKNDGALPLDRNALRSVAIIGPNARVAQIMGGGSSEVNAHYRIAPYDGVVAKLPPSVTVGFEEGCSNHRLLPVAPGERLRAGAQGDAPGMLLEYFNGDSPTGPIAATASVTDPVELLWFGKVPAGVDREQFCVRLSGRFVPQQSGVTTFSLTSAGRSRLFIDGALAIDNWSGWTPGTQGNYFGMGSDEQLHPVELTAGRAYTLVVEFQQPRGQDFCGVRLGLLDPQPADKRDRAVRLAAEADVALIFAGLSGEWDSEGFDRTTLDLPAEQNDLIERVAAVNPKTIVVLNTGSAVTMPWLDRVAAVLQAGYPGQEAGNAIADLLFGDANPSGKLTQTYPRRIEDTPAYLNFPGENGHVLYGERIFVGYRWYDARQIEPLFPFGYGLSYTTFAYDHLRLSAETLTPDQPLEVAIDITNTGARAGQEVVQVYVRDPQARLLRPEKELKAFAKIHLEPGERRTVRLTLDRRAFAFFDDSIHRWVAEAGQYLILVGASSRDLRASAVCTLTATQEWL